MECVYLASNMKLLLQTIVLKDPNQGTSGNRSPLNPLGPEGGFMGDGKPDCLAEQAWQQINII
jgi:hypothetical protein